MSFKKILKEIKRNTFFYLDIFLAKKAEMRSGSELLRSTVQNKNTYVSVSKIMMHGTVVASSVTSQKEDPSFKPSSKPLFVELSCSLCAPRCHVLWILPQSKVMNIRLIGNIKLVIGVNKGMNSCLSPSPLQQTDTLSRVYTPTLPTHLP